MRVGTLNDLMLDLGVSKSFACALKRAAGEALQVKLGRKFQLDIPIRFWKRHPDFKMSDVYKRKEKQEPLTV